MYSTLYESYGILYVAVRVSLLGGGATQDQDEMQLPQA